MGCRKRAKPSKNESESPAENSVTEFSMRSEARKTCWFFCLFLARETKSGRGTLKAGIVCTVPGKTK